MEISKTVESKQSKTGSLVPIVNQIHLHSIYNPEKEAEQFAHKNLDKINSNSNILILGLGYGYHVNEIAKEAEAIYGNKYSIVIIEPISVLHEKCIEHKTLRQTENLKIFTGDNASEYFNKLELVNFLVKRPCIITHPASFNLNIEFYKKFLGYCAPTNLGSISKDLNNEELKEYILGFDQDANIDNVLNHLSKQNVQVNENIEFLLLAYRSMILN